MAVDLRSSKTGYLTLDQAAAINRSDETMRRFVAGLPKAELHLHIRRISSGTPINMGRRTGATSSRATTRPRENAASPRTSASSSRAIRSRRPSPRPKKRPCSWRSSAPTARPSPRDLLDILLLYIIFCHILQLIMAESTSTRSAPRSRGAPSVCAGLSPINKRRGSRRT